jgi:N-acetylneuraminic acid mutarotase
LNTAVEYDPVTDGWTNCGSACAPLSAARSALAAAAVNGKVYVIGGVTESGDATGAVEEFDPSLNQWTHCGGTCKAMPTARFAHALGVVNGLIYAVGGHDGTNALNTVEIYDPVSNGWSAGTAMPTAREKLTVSAVNGKIYAIGGHGSSVLGVVEEYDAANDQWSNCGGTCATLPTARKSAASAAVLGKIYVIGGAGPLATVEAFDPAANSWATKTAMPTAREQLGVAVEETLGHIYAIGGWSGSAPLAAVELYDPGADP